MGHHQQAQVPAGGLAEEEIPYLGLGDQIQHGGALIAEEELHRGMEGAGQAEPLELAAGKLPGVAGEPALPDVEGIQQGVAPGMPDSAKVLPKGSRGSTTVSGCCHTICTGQGPA